MRRWLLMLLVVSAGCRTCEDHISASVDHLIADVAARKAQPFVLPCTAIVLVPDGPLDFPALWNLALQHNPSLREAAAEVEAARGRLFQAGRYPNPRLLYMQDALGSNLASEGNISFQVNQEIVTAGKRGLDLQVASRNLDASSVSLLGRKFDILTRIRRAYYDYLSLAYTLRVNEEVVKSLEESVENTRKLVEDAKTRPKDDLLRLQALMEQARISQSRNRTNLAAAWKQLAAEVGVPDLPLPKAQGSLTEAVPSWEEGQIVRRVQSSNTELYQAALEADRARLEYERARAEVVPNVSIGAGWGHNAVEQTAGAVISLETPIPLWDRKQGRIHEARAKWEQAEAARRTAADRLSRDTAEAFARYDGAKLQEERMRKEVLPRLEETLKLVRQGFNVGRPGTTFLDVQDAVEKLNDARLKLAEVRRELWRAVADLQGLMQLTFEEDLASDKDSPTRMSGLR